jgi:tetratricopeptide (TPR) repeat protein
MADYFISYTSSDRDWAQWIGKELAALAHTPHIHEWEIEGGEDIYAWMEARHDAADHVLCVVSDEYLKAPYSTLERNAALWQAAKNRTSFVLFVVVKPCRLPTLIDHISRCELFGVPEEAARKRFREFMGRREAPETAAFPGKVFAVSNIPIRVPMHFMGRDHDLAAIATALKQDGGHVAVATLHGMRGVGKTTLAASYAELHRGDYRATWWIRAQTATGMRADLVALGVRLGWVGADEKEEPALSAVTERLRNEGEGILLIFDNAVDADALEPYLPRAGGSHVLITSNAQAWRAVAAPVEIRIWPTSIGADYLLARTGGEEKRMAAEALSESLGGLPLAHEQAAAYCERLEKSLADYRKRFEATPARLLDDERDAPAEYHDRRTVAKTFALAIEEAAKLHPAAEALITHAALLAPEPIPLFLFIEGCKELGEPLASTLADDGLDEALSALRAFALIDREMIVDERDPAIRTGTIRLHRLVRQVAAARRVDEARESARRALVAALAAVYPRELRDPGGWPPARRLDAHALAMVGGDAAPPAGAELPASELLDGLAAYRHYALAAYAQARPLYERALAIRESVLGTAHPYTASSLNHLGLLLKDQRDLAAARAPLERALAIRETALGPDHPDTAASLNNLADLLQDQGDLAGAQARLERANAIYESVLGPDHPDAAPGLNNLAHLLQIQGDLVGARQLYERALAINQKVFGSDHSFTATNFNNLASLLQAQGDHAGARQLYERALAIDEKVLGPDHPETLKSLNTLAGVLHDQGDLAGARPLYERALAISEKLLGANESQTAQCLNNLAILLQDQGDLATARPLYERALAIYEMRLGSDHPNTNRARHNLARLLVATARPADALALGQSALAAHETALGPDHAWTRDSARVTADALDALARSSDAAATRKRYGLGA